MYLCVYLCTFFNICVYFYIFALISKRCTARFATTNPKLFIIFFGCHQLSKISKIFKCPKTSKIDISWPLAFPVTYRTHQKSIFWWIFKNFKIVKNRIFWLKFEASPVFSTTAYTCIESAVCGCAVLWFMGYRSFRRPPWLMVWKDL